MPLSPPLSERTPLHTRRVVCQGYRRPDGLWDIEGHITDSKAYDFTTEERGAVSAGTPVHDMWIRLTLTDDLEVRAIEAVTDFSPFPEICPGIVMAYQQVVGLRIGPGWTRALKERLGGIHGCTHLTELLGPLATTAFQTIVPILAQEEQKRAGKSPKAGMGPRARTLLNTCHTFREDGPVVRRYLADNS